ncbi:ACT domain-containing protein [Qipengyuania sp. JC766]|uniref:ACT domain-containing protein n=1 Tax=Qipengyuania sp. JC766 TaxID=3232139 RepID=UPI00345945EA
MTLEHIRIEFLCGEGTLRRILGVIETRGFHVRSMQMGSDCDRSVMTLAVDPRDGTRRIETLMRQLARLYEVEQAFRLTNAPPVMEVPRAASA